MFAHCNASTLPPRPRQAPGQNANECPQSSRSKKTSKAPCRGKQVSSPSLQERRQKTPNGAGQASMFAGSNKECFPCQGRHGSSSAQPRHLLLRREEEKRGGQGKKSKCVCPAGNVSSHRECLLCMSCCCSSTAVHLLMYPCTLFECPFLLRLWAMDYLYIMPPCSWALPLT